MIIVERADGLVLVQDVGRPGQGRLGVAPSGAFDVGAHVAANVAVGNPASAATLEVLLGPLVLRARRPVIAAVTGGSGAVVVDGLALAAGQPFALLPGMSLTLEPSADGVRRYLAVRGGIEVTPVLGSRSRDTLAGLGPAPIVAGDVLRCGDPDSGSPPGGRRAVPDEGSIVARHRADDDGGALVLEVLPGPRPEYFAPGTYLGLGEHTFTVTDRCDRVAVRLQGRPLVRTGTQELPPEGVIAGAIQVPPSLQPVILGPDHPLTGGYPVLAVATRAALDALAQVRPGDVIRFRPLESGD